ncbi:MAG: YdcF family protein [Rhodothermaceae bacterium]|nr:YdcF family protein [Rhodothermaceae bacterium]
MFEFIARFILNLVMPLNLVFILFGVGGVLLVLKWYRGAVATISGAVIILLISLTPYLPDLVTASLQDRYDVFRPEDNPDLLRVPDESGPDTLLSPTVHIIVLGGGHNPDPWLPPANRLSSRALGRLTEGIRLHNRIPGSLLIFSGWSSSGGQSVAEVMGLAAIDLGVDEDRISLLTRPNDTCREAQEYFLRFGSGTPLILVTSATHMPAAFPTDGA